MFYCSLNILIPFVEKIWFLKTIILSAFLAVWVMLSPSIHSGYFAQGLHGRDTITTLTLEAGKLPQSGWPSHWKSRCCSQGLLPVSQPADHQVRPSLCDHSNNRMIWGTENSSLGLKYQPICQSLTLAISFLLQTPASFPTCTKENPMAEPSLLWEGSALNLLALIHW